MTKELKDGTPRARSARSGTERQKEYRAKRRTVSIDISGETADLIRTLRQATNSTTDAVLSRALKALQELPVPEQTDSQRGSEPKRSRRGSHAQPAHSAQQVSPGDETDAPRKVPDEVAASAARRSAGKRTKQKKDDTPETQRRMDF